MNSAACSSHTTLAHPASSLLALRLCFPVHTTAFFPLFFPLHNSSGLQDPGNPGSPGLPGDRHRNHHNTHTQPTHRPSSPARAENTTGRLQASDSDWDSYDTRHTCLLTLSLASHTQPKSLRLHTPPTYAVTLYTTYITHSTTTSHLSSLLSFPTTIRRISPPLRPLSVATCLILNHRRLGTLPAHLLISSLPHSLIPPPVDTLRSVPPEAPRIPRYRSLALIIEKPPDALSLRDDKAKDGQTAGHDLRNGSR